MSIEKRLNKEDTVYICNGGGCRRAKRSYSTFKVRRGGGEEIPIVQGKEQWLRFAGAAVRRYPTSKVREAQVRRQALREGSEGRQTETTITDN